MQAYTLQELVRRTMTQVGLEEEDLCDYRQAIRQYLNEGYSDLVRDAYRPWHEEICTVERGTVHFAQLRHRPSRVIGAWLDRVPVTAQMIAPRRQIRFTEMEEGARVLIRYSYLPRPLEEPEDTPKLPAWAHGALADWASWRIYMQGNAQRQQRGLMFRQAYDEIKRRLRPQGEERLGYGKFRNLYREE